MTALYDTIGKTYAQYRQPDERIAAQIASALGNAGSVVNIGSGAGSYEPSRRRVVGVEPSNVMIAQRAVTAAPVVRGVAERLPFPDNTFDVALAILTVHHWPDPAAGLAEMQRVAPRQVVLTWDPQVAAQFWLVRDYLPQIDKMEVPLATLATVSRALTVTETRTVPVPWDCTDGFLGAYWRRPHAYLEAGARAAISGLSLLDQTVVDQAMERLRQDLDDGTWNRRHADKAAATEADLGYRLVIATSARKPAEPVRGL